MNVMASTQLPRFLSVLAVVLFTSNIDDGGCNDVNDLNAFSQRQIPEPFQPLHPVESLIWRSPENLGEISGVAVLPSGFPVIFHRADRTWSYDTFNDKAEYQEEYRGPIPVDTVLTLHHKTGRVLSGWGNHTFYLPHGIYVDNWGNIWLTDVALHQVFKVSPSGVIRLILGQRFEPGTDLRHFCQPTAVAVLPTREIVVADGYCNRRILLFDRKGEPIYNINEEWIPLNVPHALTVLPNRQQICVADREHWRIVCLPWNEYETDAENSPSSYLICNEDFGRIFGITSYRGIIYAVNGPTLKPNNETVKVRGFTINSLNKNVTGFWKPEFSSFENPHAIALGPWALYVSEIGPNRVWKFDLV